MNNHIETLKSWINSCLTPDQLQTCIDHYEAFYNEGKINLAGYTILNQTMLDKIEAMQSEITALKDPAIKPDVTIKVYEPKLPTTPEEYDAAQAEWVKKHNIKMGSKVKILRAFKDCEHGIKFAMHPDMNLLIGSIQKVRKVNNHAISVNEENVNWWSWPYFCLEPIND